MAVSFNGITKRITVSGYADFATVDVETAIYSGWKHWMALSDNAKYLQALRPVGGDPIGGTQTVPPYFFLMNNWKIVVDGIQNLAFNTNLYCEEASNTDTNPFLISNNGSVISKTSDAPVNTIEVSTIAYSLELNGNVYLDVTNGSDAAAHAGTIAKPVRTLTKAMAICIEQNISTIQLAGTLVLDQDVSGKEFISWKNGKIDVNSQPCIATRFRELKLFGVQHIGSLLLCYNCRIANLQNLKGVFDFCKFVSADALSLQSGQTSLGGSSAHILGFDIITFDLSAGGVELEIRTLSAGLKIQNSRHSNNYISIGFNSGILQIDSTCTAGVIYAGGLFSLYDASENDCIVHTEGKTLSTNQIPDIVENVWSYER